MNVPMVGTGDIFRAIDRGYMPVVTVNCVGVPGKGLALSWARRYPADARAYKELCLLGKLRPGGVTRIGPCVVAATKDHWRQPSRYEWIEAASRKLAAGLDDNPEVNIALTPMGAGNGWLDADRCAAIIRRHLDRFGARVAYWLPGQSERDAFSIAELGEI